MVFVEGIISGIIILSLGVFVVLFGSLPKFQNTPIGWSYKLVMVWIPAILGGIDRIITGGRIVRSTKRMFTYLLFEKHPLIKYFYLGLVSVGIYLFYIGTWQYLWSTWHKLGVVVACSLPYITMYLASNSDPGFISHENHANSMNLYPFDYALYHPGNICKTCHFEKPARSKHCSICKRCISRLDHHCVWVNNCVGHGNTQYFLYFLFATINILVYGTYLTTVVMNSAIEAGLPPHIKWSDLSWKNYGNRWFLSLLHYTWCGLLQLLVSMCSLMAIGFTAYHIYLIWAGMTTNETMKWTDIKDDIRYRESYMAVLPDSLQRSFYEASELSAKNWPNGVERVVKRAINQEEVEQLDQRLTWHEVNSVHELDNLYDIGFKRYLKLILRPTKV